jgi:uncharacterized protein YcgL (UPF0745 family)
MYKKRIRNLLFINNLILNNMKKIYYYVIEQYGENIGHQGYYMTLKEAENRADELKDMFHHAEFYVYPNDSRREPNFLTI